MLRQKLLASLLLGISFWMLAGCETPLSQFEVQRPARVSVPRQVTKVFIKRAQIKDINDELKLKEQVLQHLAAQLNSFGRFEVQVVDDIDESKIDREKETIGIIQGEIISGGEVDRGQFTETAMCKGGIAGRLIAAGSAAATDAAITLDSHAFVCKTGGIKTALVEGATTQLLAMALKTAKPPEDEVVRAYNYKNISLFAQASFSFSIIGQTRETLAIRADAASFGRHAIDKNSYRNVTEGRPHPLVRASIQVFKLPTFPITIRPAGVVTDSIPKDDYYANPQLPVPSVRDIDPQEKQEVIKQLVAESVQPFIQTISPYRIKIQTEIASGGKAEVQELLKKGQWKTARERIETLSQNDRTPPDWYNLGLAYEGNAIVVEDYEDARRFYIEALNRDPGNKLYAMSIGRMAQRLSEARKLRQQTQ
ncbi:MAG: hypothetical protein HQM12_12350 [SAR324 cluster bacterium]|nr:hypothetical protein [SAR324 cluster bacterium]